MLPRIQINNQLFLVIASLLVFATTLHVSQPAAAYDFQNAYGVYQLGDPDDPNDPNHLNTINNINNRVCSIDINLPSDQNLIKYGLTKRIVLCVKEAILAAVQHVLIPFADIFARTIGIMCTLAVAVWGIQMVAGRQSAPTREAFTLGIKIGVVIMFTSSLYGGFAADIFDPDNNHGGFFGMMLDAMEEMLRIVTGYVTAGSSFTANCPAFATPVDPGDPLYVLTVWDTVDCAIDSLIGGLFSPATLGAGLVGFLIAALVSNVVGLFIAFLGFALIAMLLMAIARAMYIFITAYIAFALMVLISPMFIPLVLFRSTKAYAEKWLRLTIGFILQPIFIFAYLAMMLAAYDTIVYTGDRSLVRSIIGNHIDEPYYLNSPSDPDTPGVSGEPGTWFNQFAFYIEMKKGETSVNLDYKDIDEVCTESSCETQEGVSKHDIGVLDVIGEQVVERGEQWQNDIYSVLGNENIFRTSIPLRGLDFEWMAMLANFHGGNFDAFFSYLLYLNCRDNPQGAGCSDPNANNFLEDYYYPYIIAIFLSGIMAVVTAFIFMLMLEYLPFIGSGISGESLSMPTFGVGSMAPPGSGIFNNLRSKLASNFTGGSG